MIIGECDNNIKCVYDLPIEMTAEEMKSLIIGYNSNKLQREELQGQPKLLGLNGPMFNGFGTLSSTGEMVAIIRYEKTSEY